METAQQSTLQSMAPKGPSHTTAPRAQARLREESSVESVDSVQTLTQAGQFSHYTQGVLGLSVAPSYS